MKRSLLAVALLTAAVPAHAKTKSKTETTGDIIQFAVPLAGAALAWHKDDDEGLYQLGKGALITGLITHSLKFSVDELRPNGSDFNSFPSGHTSAAFSGAAFIHHRYGIEYGIPAYIAATYVGYSRVYASKHWDHDVLAGALLAYTVSHFVTTEYQDPNLTVTPVKFGNTDAQGINFSYTF